MIGNDVVDLRDPDADFASFSPRFDVRVFSASERRRIQASADPEACRWRLWAAKEAVFKAARKADPGAVFSPRRFEVRSPGSDFREAEVRVESARSSRSRIFSGASMVSRRRVRSRRRGRRTRSMRAWTRACSDVKTSTIRK